MKLRTQELEDLASSLSFTIKNYPKDGSKEFRKACERLLKKIWKEINSK